MLQIMPVQHAHYPAHVYAARPCPCMCCMRVHVHACSNLCIPCSISMPLVHSTSPCCTVMLHVLPVCHAPCPDGMSMSVLHICVNAARPCLCCMSMFMLHVHVRDICQRGMLTVNVNAACPCSCCMPMLLLHAHVHAACPDPCCMSTFVLHVHVHAVYSCLHTACPWCMLC
jgi:hypothetical protein